jgi:hypothetical protein
MKGLAMKDILFLDNMITPKIITVVYWVLMAGIAIGGLAYTFNGGGILGFVGMLGGLVFARIWCELFIVFFKMNEALQERRSQ